MQDVQDGLAEPELGKGAPHPKSGGARAFVESERVVRAIYLVVGAVTIGLIFWRLQFSNQSVCCGDFDGYYHIRWSRLLWENMRRGHFFPPTFKWLPLTTLNPKDYVDHHLLFHIL